MKAQWKMVRLVAVSVCIALIVPPGVMADNKSSGGESGSSFSASDASYAEVAAIAYAELRDSAGIIHAKIRSVGGAEKSKIILYSDSVFGQLTALDIANSQIASMGTGLCSLSQGVIPPQKPSQPAGGARYAVAWSGEIGSILSGIAAIAQMFAPQSASVSTSLTPDDDALKADLADVVMTSKSEIIFPDLFLPPLASEQSLHLTKGADLCGGFRWDPATSDFYTLWIRLVALATELHNKPTQSAALKQALKDYTTFENNLMSEQKDGPAPYERLLKSARLKALLNETPSPVVLLVAVDAMGGTTWSEGKTIFTEHTSFSGGVVVRYMAFQFAKLIAAGTVTRTISDRKAKDEDIKAMFNHP